MAVFDPYEQRARVLPALFVGLPAAILVAVLLLPAWVAVIAAGLVEVGLGVPLTDAVRKRGRETQAILWSRWGGSPLATRLATPTPDPIAENTRLRALAYLRITYPDQLIPDRGAPAEFEPVADLARHHVRRLDGSQIVNEESRNYGFHRNLLGIRHLGVFSGIACCVGIGVVGTLTDSRFTLLGALGAISIAVWFWLYPTEQRVHDAADLYANAAMGLLASGHVN